MKKTWKRLCTGFLALATVVKIHIRYQDMIEKMKVIRRFYIIMCTVRMERIFISGEILRYVRF